jgi:hypothetical protein
MLIVSRTLDGYVSVARDDGNTVDSISLGAMTLPEAERLASILKASFVCEATLD